MRRTQFDITIETGPVRCYSIVSDNEKLAIDYAVSEYRKENGFSPSAQDVRTEAYPLTE